MTLARIAVTTDFSQESRAAFPVAASLARKFSAELDVVHYAQAPVAVISPWPEVGPFLPHGDPYEEVGRRLSDLVKEEKAFDGLKASARVARGEAAEGLGEFLAAEGVDLAVISSHGYSGVKHLLLGSFAEKVLRAAECPVLVVRATQAAAAAEFAPRRILVPHDFSPASRPSLGVARSWVRDFGAKARLLFVAERGASLYDYAANMQGSFQEYLEKVRDQAYERFRRLIQEDWRGLAAEAKSSVGEPGKEILREAKDFGADLIVLGTHSRSTLERFFLGSVTQRVVRGAICPVLTVRARA